MIGLQNVFKMTVQVYFNWDRIYKRGLY